MNTTELFSQVIRLPDTQLDQEASRLVGMDEYRDRLAKEALLLIQPDLLESWSKKHHKQAIAALDYFSARPPLFILAGDVGTGKTTLARTFGNDVARQAKVTVDLYALSLNTRGGGAVGEMTRLISEAFGVVCQAATKSRGANGRASRGIIMLIDEADALAQSREAAQMHHEDRAGVNALIRGIDQIAAEQLPVAVLMSTNRLDAIDPAVRRRAAAVLDFKRPNKKQRQHVLQAGLHGTDMDESVIEQLGEITGTSSTRPYGFTYSDLTQRLIPAVILDAYPNAGLSAERTLEVARNTHPTPPFSQEEARREAP